MAKTAKVNTPKEDKVEALTHNGRDFFDKFGCCRAGMGPTIEEMYQAFRARMLAESMKEF